MEIAVQRVGGGEYDLWISRAEKQKQNKEREARQKDTMKTEKLK
jgi:hypothetical protein